MDDFSRQKIFHMPWSIVLSPTELATSFELLEQHEKEVFTLTLTNSHDSAPEKGFISCLSPLGRELPGRIAGDVIEIKIFFRTEMFRIVRIEE